MGVEVKLRPRSLFCAGCGVGGKGGGQGIRKVTIAAFRNDRVARNGERDLMHLHLHLHLQVFDIEGGECVAEG